MDWLGGLLSLGGALLGGIGGSQGTDPTTQTQYTQYLPPSYTPQQQAINNLLFYSSLANLYPQQSGQYQDLINQYIYGTGATTPGTTTGATTPTQATAEDIISGYETQTQEAQKAEQWVQGIDNEILRGVLKRIKSGELNPAQAEQTLRDLTGRDVGEADKLIGATYYKMQQETNPRYEEFIKLPYLDKNALSYMETDEFNKLYEEVDVPQVIDKVAEQLKEPTETPITETTTEPGAETTTDLGGLLAKIMDPSYIAEQVKLAKQGGMKDIGNWYEQAQRELEQRGITQRGGYEGSGTEKDIGGILGKRGEMETDLGRRLSEFQIGAEKQNWYDALNALTGLQTLQGNLQAQTATPWMGAAQQMVNVPYNQMTTSTTPGTSPGIIPGALGGLYAGMGAYGMGQNLGWWGQKNQQTNPYNAQTYTFGGLPSSGGLYNR